RGFLAVEDPQLRDLAGHGAPGVRVVVAPDADERQNAARAAAVDFPDDLVVHAHRGAGHPRQHGLHSPVSFVRVFVSQVVFESAGASPSASRSTGSTSPCRTRSTTTGTTASLTASAASSSMAPSMDITSMTVPREASGCRAERMRT